MAKNKTCFSCALWNGSCCGKVFIENRHSSDEEYTCDNWVEFTILNWLLDLIKIKIGLLKKEVVPKVMEFEVRLNNINNQTIADTIIEYKVKDINNITKEEERKIKNRGEVVLRKEIGSLTEYTVAFRTIPEGDFKDLKFWGWINLNRKLGKKKQRKSMIKLGVTGKIEYNREYKCFEYCICSFNVVKKLIKEPFIPMWPGCFVAADQNGSPLLNNSQPCSDMS